MAARHTANNRTPYKSLKGETPDISALVEFDYYNFVKLRLPQGFPGDNWELARWLARTSRQHQAGTYILYHQGQWTSHCAICCTLITRSLMNERGVKLKRKHETLSTSLLRNTSAVSMKTIFNSSLITKWQNPSLTTMKIS